MENITQLNTKQNTLKKNKIHEIESILRRIKQNLTTIKKNCKIDNLIRNLEKIYEWMHD